MASNTINYYRKRYVAPVPVQNTTVQSQVPATTAAPATTTPQADPLLGTTKPTPGMTTTNPVVPQTPIIPQASSAHPPLPAKPVTDPLLGTTKPTGVSLKPTGVSLFGSRYTPPGMTTTNPVVPQTPLVPQTPIIPQASSALPPLPAKPVVDPLVTAQKGVLEKSLSGQIFDPFAAGQKEAMARTEAEQRASTAGQINQAGFSGTGVGKSIASGTEGDIRKQRYDTLIGLEKAKNEQMLNAVAPTTNFIDSIALRANTEKTQVGKDFAAYVTNHPDLTPESIASDPVLSSSLQKLWESSGQGGQFDATWGAQQVKAIKDSSNTFIMAGKAIDDAVTAGSIPKAVGDIMKNVGNKAAYWAAFDRDANGNAVPNPARMEAALGLPAGSLGGTTTTSSANSFDPAFDDLWGGKANAVLKDSSNPLYQQTIEARTNEIKSTGDYSKLKGLGVNDPVYKAVVNSVNPTPFSYRNRLWYNDEFVGAPSEGEWIKNGDTMLKVTFNGHLNTAGTSDRAYMEFQDADGNMYSTSGNSSNIVPGVNTKFTKK